MYHRNPIRTRMDAFIISGAQYLQMTICDLQVVDKALLHFVINKMAEILAKAW